MKTRPGDYCPARIEPRPAGVPAATQLRAVVHPDGQLVIAWLSPGGSITVARAHAGQHQVRQAGCRCTANPRLAGADLT